MEDLVKQAFLNVDGYGPYVQQGHYDLVSPDGEIILPQVWELLVQPGWAISMHMWPMPESANLNTPESVPPRPGDQPLKAGDAKLKRPKKAVPSGLYNMRSFRGTPKRAPGSRILNTQTGKDSPGRILAGKPIRDLERNSMHQMEHTRRTNTKELGSKDQSEGPSNMSLELNNAIPDPAHDTMEVHILADLFDTLNVDPEQVQDRLPDVWQWDINYHTSRGVWTCIPLESHQPPCFPLTIAGAPVVLPVEYRWPPIGGVNPPPDPRLSSPVDCRAELTVDIIRDVLTTFEGSIGFYMLINGLLQVLVSPEFDTIWASSHLPHKFGGLKVSYIQQTLDPTMLPANTAIAKTKPSTASQRVSTFNLLRFPHPGAATTTPGLKLNDFIEARGKTTHREKYTGRIGLKVAANDVHYLIMSSHVIAEAMLAKSIFSRSRVPIERLQGDWNEFADIWAGNEIVGYNRFKKDV